MRLAPWVALLMLMPLGGCHDVRVARGLPVLAKGPDGVLISGAEGLPDIERGNQARLAGRLDEAERDLLPLAERGYVDAQFYLAAVYGQRESMESQDAAIKWYRAVLPRRPDAVIPLARVLMRRGDRASVLEAGDLLLHAQNGLDEDAIDAALLDLYSLFPALDARKQGPALAQRAGKSRSMGTRSAAINWYRASLAQPGNGLKLVDLCRRSVQDVPACFVVLTTYYRYTGKQPALADLVTRATRTLQRPVSYANFDDLYYDPIVLPQIASRMAIALIDQPATEELAELNEDLALANEAERDAAAEAGESGVDTAASQDALPQYSDAPGQPVARSESSTPKMPPAAPATNAPSSGTAQPELADRLLRWMLKQPGAMPVEAAGVAVAFPYLLSDVNIESVLQTGAKAGIPSASLYLGQLYYFNQRVPRDALLGEQSLLQALLFRETAAPGHYRLGRLYQQGYLGRPDPQKALDHYLYAARRRVTAADRHLARLFYDSPGARVNRVNSYVFARLAEDSGFPVLIHSLRGGTVRTHRLLDRLRTELTPEELRKAESLYEQERAVHLVTPPPISPDIWVRNAG